MNNDSTDTPTTPLVSPLNAWFSPIDQVTQHLAQQAQAISETVSQAAQTSLDQASEVAQQVSDQLAPVTGQIQATADQMTQQAQQVGQNLLQQAQDLSTNVPEPMQTFIVQTQETLQKVQAVIDPREIAGGYAGMTAGETVGGAIGGTIGGVVLGPVGVVMGVGVGSFTGGMIGLKVGADITHEALKPQTDDSAAVESLTDPVATEVASVGNFLGTKTAEQVGEILGVAVGSSVGMVIAGPVGGAIGAVIGETVGGQLGEDAIAQVNPQSAEEKATVADKWLQKFGKNTLGETTTTVLGAVVGRSLLGIQGEQIGSRIGTLVGKRVEWHEVLPDNAPNDAVAAEPTKAVPASYSIVHRTTGRIRLKIDRLSTDTAYANQLRSLIEAWPEVTEVRLNATAASITIYYQTSQVSDAAFEQKLMAVVLCKV